MHAHCLIWVHHTFVSATFARLCNLQPKLLQEKVFVLGIYMVQAFVLPFGCDYFILPVLCILTVMNRTGV